MERIKRVAAHVLGSADSSQPPSSTQQSKAEAEQEFVDVRYKARTGLTSRAKYVALYRESLDNPAAFWSKQADQLGLAWRKKGSQQHASWNFDRSKGAVATAWFKGWQTNLSFNCLDRHIEQGRGDAPCLLWEGNDPGQERTLSYAQTLAEVCSLANWMKKQGVKQGDAVAVYMPMVCELPIAMLACTRIGAVHTVVFAGFSAESLAQRMADSKAKLLLTASCGARGKKSIPLKGIADEACSLSAKAGHKVPAVLVYEHPALPKGKCPVTQGRDTWWAEALSGQSTSCAPVWLDAEAPLFLLYTSGSTGQPKGVVHTTAGYMVQVACSARYVFDMQPGDVFWCTADAGWITGHSYLAYGPLLCGAANVIFEGVPVYPNPGRMWDIVDKLKVRQLYTAPTAIRSLEAQDSKWVTSHDLSSLRILGTVGEPINPRAWQWFFEVVGKKRCPIVDTWWQTETGSIAITALPGAFPLKPGCATLPFFGYAPVLLDDKGRELQGEAEGILCIKQAWPSMFRTLFNAQERFEEAYFSSFKGYYFTGDGAKRSKDGYITITGRVDDVINVSGHRVGTAEVESALASHGACVEAAVVGIDHEIKGSSIYAFVSLADGHKFSDAIKKDLSQTVRQQIGAFAVPDVIHWAPGLPKTRSGKIMRRILRKIASLEDKDLGDTSSLQDPTVVQALIELRGK